MLAMMRSFPPRRAQPAISIPNTLRDIDAGVRREPAGPGGAVGVSFQSLQSRRHGLQREQLLACSWTHGDAIGDRVTQQVV
jgi:hypothetical protein